VRAGGAKEGWAEYLSKETVRAVYAGSRALITNKLLLVASLLTAPCSIVKLMKKRFENDCFDVDTAKNGIEALAKMQNTIYTMVFLDIHMEPMDG